MSDGLTVETETNNSSTYSAQTICDTNKINKNSSGLLVETTKETSESTTSDTKNDNNKDSEDSTVSEAVLGLIMLQGHNPTENTLLQKYDNSSILHVDAARQVDYRKTLTWNMQIMTVTKTLAMTVMIP